MPSTNHTDGRVLGDDGGGGGGDNTGHQFDAIYCDITNELDDDSSEAAQLAVASAEEYAAKIVKLQQACLIPLKEDLADWLNKILKTSQITTYNFMEKLDNGVILCRLAKIISQWCKQLQQQQQQQQINHHHIHHHHFRIQQIKIWEGAKCRTFYARDNVCNFIRWSRDFGVNRSVVFESDDLVLHANPRQVVLCLLDVARIAYIKYNFTEAPGLVKFEQEIDNKPSVKHGRDENGYNDVGGQLTKTNYCDNNLYDATSNNDGVARKNLLIASKRTRASIGDATDELVLRYCRHKEEEAERKRQREKQDELERLEAEKRRLAEQEEEEEKMREQERLRQITILNDQMIDAHSELVVSSSADNNSTINYNNDNANNDQDITTNGNNTATGINDNITTLSNSDNNGNDITRSINEEDEDESQDIEPDSLMQKSQLEQEPSDDFNVTSTRSSPLSNQDCNNSTSTTYGRQITSDLDGKVMRIAKTYYGKKATKDVTRLSEGKYRIADRIVFVRLLKGHRVMVRIGGGWDTLENFLSRHKSDPTQVIDPDNLLPLKTLKIPIEKINNHSHNHNQHSSQRSTPIHSKLPNSYRRSNSASSTNLSLSNLSYSNLSLTNSRIPMTPLRIVPNKRLNRTTMNGFHSSTPSIDKTRTIM